MSKLKQVAKTGQSIWFDYIRRSFIKNGGLQQLIDLRLLGITSNPTIFEKAIAGSADYDGALKELAATNKSIDDIYEALVIEDIGRAADLFQAVYESTDGLDGYVSPDVLMDAVEKIQNFVDDIKAEGFTHALLLGMGGSSLAPEVLRFGMKAPGAGFHIKPVDMDFHYQDLGDIEIPEAYERLLLDCIQGDATLYARSDAVEACWAFITPILKAWPG